MSGGSGLRLVRQVAAIWLVLSIPLLSCSKDGGGSSSSSPASPSATAGASLEQRTFAKINDYRVSKRLPALAWSDAIAAQARRHSQDMASGTVPVGHDGFEDRAAAIGRTTPWSSAAENVAMNWNAGDPVTAAVNDWLKSTGHLANIEGSFDTTGIGTATAANGAVYFTQIFIKSR